jgi:hypothetical protein
MELYVFPGAIQHWNKALGTLDRSELDIQQSNESQERSESSNPWWHLLSIIFRNRASFNRFQPFN